MKTRLVENVITLRIVSETPIPADTHIANISFIVCTHVAALIGQTIKSRTMTAAETAAIDPTVRAMIGDVPDRTAVTDDGALAIAQVAGEIRQAELVSHIAREFIDELEREPCRLCGDRGGDPVNPVDPCPFCGRLRG